MFGGDDRAKRPAMLVEPEADLDPAEFLGIEADRQPILPLRDAVRDREADALAERAGDRHRLRGGRGHWSRGCGGGRRGDGCRGGMKRLGGRRGGRGEGVKRGGGQHVIMDKPRRRRWRRGRRYGRRDRVDDRDGRLVTRG